MKIRSFRSSLASVHEGPENASPQTPAIAIGSVRFVEAGNDD